MMDDEEQAPAWQKNEIGMQDARSGAREGWTNKRLNSIID
jgi:hypothetical protein